MRDLRGDYLCNKTMLRGGPCTNCAVHHIIRPHPKGARAYDRIGVSGEAEDLTYGLACCCKASMAS